MKSCAIIGFGGLGRLHLSNIDKIAGKRNDFWLKGICGTTREKFKEGVNLNIGSCDISHVDPERFDFYDDYKELIQKEKPDFVFITLPSYLHAEVAIYALENGCDVFCEKPMALNPEECEKMLDAARKNNKKLVIGQCLRFDLAFEIIKNLIESNKYGKCVSAHLRRFSETPTWSWNNWLLDTKLSGGCPIDFHIHDVDVVNWLFGKPDTVHSIMTSQKYEMESIYTHYTYNNGLKITSSADWSMAKTFPFEEGSLFNFEKANVSVSPEKITIYTEDDVIEYEHDDRECFEKEMVAFLKYVIDDEYTEALSCETAYESIKIAMAEIESSKKSEIISL